MQVYQQFVHDEIRRRFFHGNIPESQLVAARAELTRQFVDGHLLQQAAAARIHATRAEPKTKDAAQDQEANLSQALQKLIDEQIWIKKKR